MLEMTKEKKDRLTRKIIRGAEVRLGVQCVMRGFPAWRLFDADDDGDYPNMVLEIPCSDANAAQVLFEAGSLLGLATIDTATEVEHVRPTRVKRSARGWEIEWLHVSYVHPADMAEYACVVAAEAVKGGGEVVP